MTWIKICGITNLDDALAATDAGANALGFVFYPKSPRYVTLETARSIVERVPHPMEKVGVFVNETLECVRDTAKQLGLRPCNCTATKARNSAAGSSRNSGTGPVAP